MPSRQRRRPFDPAIQTVPSGASQIDQAVPWPVTSVSSTCSKTPRSYRTTFSLRPSQSPPFRSSISESVDPFARNRLALPSKTVKLAPSKRTSPSYVPNQRLPSRVLTMAVTVFCGSPCSVCQTSS